ncbi:MAG: insulinase family protein [Flavobacteriales bacterium]|nr:insulinase family protein [Flavobacteriales bacterium]MCB9205395.1 insulinase family protein [Flavobacteriales bacterium]
MQEERYERWTLSNGIRCIHRDVNSPVAHLGFFVNMGSRDELPEEHGLAHFVEHTIFKGTKRRKAYHVLSRMEDIGGELNAYTTKEETVVHATFLNEHYGRAAELFSDIIFNSTFPKKELEKEKSVIEDEINSYLDSPSDMIFDEFDELIFDGHPLGRNTLGTPDSVHSFNADSVKRFLHRGYRTDQMVITSVGRIDLRKLKKMLERYFSADITSIDGHERTSFSGYKPKRIELEKSNYQTHLMMGTEAYRSDHDDRIGLFLLSNLLGGPGMNARLHMTLRERHGYTYNVETNYSSFSDTGLFSIYLGMDERYLNKCIDLTHKELRLLREKGLGTLQLHKAKQQILGQVAIGQENNQSQMLGIGKSILTNDEVRTWKEITDKIEALTSKQLLRIANEILNEKDFSYLIYRKR